MAISLFYVPCADDAIAGQLVETLLAEKLIACGNTIRSTSYFFWDNAQQCEDEEIAILKTSPENKEAVMNRVEALVGYEMPCILTFLAEANPAYEAWVRSQVEHPQLPKK